MRAVDSPAARFDRLDALRGAAIAWMALFHFCFDLNYFNLLEPAQNFYRDPFWTLQRTAIVSLFVFVAGVSQALAIEAGQSAARFWRRWAQIAGCALLVSIGSALMFPDSWISFGILHGMALMLVASRLLAPLRWPLLPLAALAIALPHWVQHPVFDTRWTYWTGLVTRKPVTEDYAPVLPWLGVMLIGLAAGRWLLAHRRDVLAGALPAALAPLAALGRWPLTFYMLHQPVLIGAILAWRRLSGAA
ncbi:MAG TPA: heparan-alpha-glucosaminide N-acetyltransferase [Burkholderiaceae bacterium]|nr:heparan-alpha-glucosaminide N-acetyltransferase [Burkholderiaceae bacterium]